MNTDQASFNNSQRRQSAGFFRWGAPGEPTAVYFHLNTVELLERDAARADKSVAAGVLLGKKPAGRQSGWMVENYEPIPDSTFKTTDSLFGDPRQLKGIIDRWRSKPSRRMEVLGFYRSCPAGEATLSEDDLSVVTANSDEPESLFLLIEPRSGLASKATLFLLKDHAVQWQWTLEPFGRSELARKGGTAPPAPVTPPEWTAPLPEVEKPTRPRPELPAETRSARLREAERAAAERAAEQQPEERSTRPQEFRIPKKWQWAVGAAVIVLLALMALFQLRGHRPSASEVSAVDSDLGLKLDREGNDLRLSWNPNAPAILNAKTGQVIITDANGTLRKIVDLSDTDLVNGTVAYSPSAGDAMLKLQVSSDGAPTISETVQITADALPAASSPDSNPLNSGAAQSGNQSTPALSAEEVSEIERQAGISPRSPGPSVASYPSRASTYEAPSGSRLKTDSQLRLDQSSLRPKPTNAPRTSEVKRARVASGSGVAGAPIASPATRGVPLSSAMTVQAEKIPVLPALASNIAASVPASASTSAPRTSRRGGVVQPAQLISNVNPIYPADARSSGISGAVELRFKIATNGDVHDVNIVRGPAVLAQAAVEAVLNRKYKPAAVDGVPTETDATAIFDFKLN